MNNPSFRAARTVLLALALPVGAMAADVFQVTATVEGSTASTSLSNAEDVFDALTNTGLGRLNPAYTGTQAASVDIGFRGVAMSARYVTPGSNALVFDIPGLGFSRTFEGASRDESQREFKQYIKDNRDDLLGRLFRLLAKESPVDPIAGNPNSLMSRLVMQDFFNGSRLLGGRDEQGGQRGFVGLGANASSFSQGGLRSTALTIPLSYVIRVPIQPGRQYGLHLPLTVVDTAGSKTYSLAPSVSARFPVNDDWALSPALGLGLTFSRDLASVGSIWSASLTSSYILSLGRRDLTIVNMIGRYQTLKIKNGDYSADPGIGNTVLKNGLILSQPTSFLAGRGSLELSWANTQFFGSDLYVQSYNEFGLSLGTNPSARSTRSFFRAGASYLYSPRSKGFNLSVSYWF